MPVPQEWDGAGMRNVRVIEIYPEPTDLIGDEHGNQIAYWAITDPSITDYGVVFEADLALVDYSIDPNQINDYDTGSDLYIRYTQPSAWIQSDHPEAVTQAQEIIRGETNPYRKAQLMHSWVSHNISSANTTVDAITALRDRQANCSVNHLYIALLRALGIPARVVSEVHPVPFLDQPRSGHYAFADGTLGAHVYAEFYLPGYGWIQSDATFSYLKFVGTDWRRVILVRGEDIKLGPNWHDPPLGWVHLPVAWGAYAEPYAYLDITPVE